MIDFKDMKSRFWKGMRLWSANKGCAEVEAAVQELIDEAKTSGYFEGYNAGRRGARPPSVLSPLGTTKPDSDSEGEEALLNRIVALEDTNAALVDILHGLVYQD